MDQQQEQSLYENIINKYSPEELKNLCGKLESMTKINQVVYIKSVVFF